MNLDIDDRRKQLELLKLFGTVDYDPRYDYKRERQRAEERLIAEGDREG